MLEKQVHWFFSDSIVPEKLFIVADHLIPNINHEYVSDTSHKSVQWTSSLTILDSPQLCPPPPPLQPT